MFADAASVMTRRIVTARPDDSVAEVARVMAAHDISAVPVCDENGAPIGMISEGDLLRPFGEQHALRRSWWLHMLADSQRLTQALVDYLAVDRRCARDLMTTPVISVTLDTSIGEIARLLLQHRIKRVPVVQNGKMVGIVSRADVILALARRPHALNGERPSLRAGGNAPLG